jgi:site-specific DNA-methyltransferase (adenine-specific)
VSAQTIPAQSVGSGAWLEPIRGDGAPHAESEGVGGALDTVAHARWEDFLPTLPDACVDLVAIDPPYGQTHCEWDTMPDFPTLWRELRRVCKGVVVMTANQPFTTDAINSNRAEFRYSWVWNKERGANFASVAFMPLRVHEDVLVFRQGAYNPQKTQGAKNHTWKPGQRMESDANRVSVKAVCDESGMKWPKSIITVPKHTSRENLHVSQKPLGLMRYLVETYSNPGDVVLDCFAGSGSTLVAAREVGRHFIGCEMLAENVAVIHERLSQAELFAGGGGGFLPLTPSPEQPRLGSNVSSSAATPGERSTDVR